MLVSPVTVSCILAPDSVAAVSSCASLCAVDYTGHWCVVWNADALHKAYFLCVVSLSLRAQETFLQWDHFRRFYNFLMADNMKKIILSHRYHFISPNLSHIYFYFNVVSKTDNMGCLFSKCFPNCLKNDNLSMQL